ncbi:MAG: hypothetical protein MUO76_10895 [Anaerolineaceae bacterium]|nr:hypothetical protein [Anaerolineaceae bacterium]
MGKYDSFSKPSKKKEKKVHPIWRGIGFVYMVLSPILAYFGTVLILEQNEVEHWFYIPYVLVARGSDPYLYVKIISTITLVFLLFVIFMALTFFVYRIFGPSSLGPTDMDRTSYRGKKYQR